MMRLLIDDLRDIEVEVVARTFDAGIEALKSQKFDILYLDHNLSDQDPKKTGYGIVRFLEANPQYLPAKVVLVSSDIVGRTKMKQVLERLYKNWTNDSDD